MKKYIIMIMILMVLLSGCGIGQKKLSQLYFDGESFDLVFAFDMRNDTLIDASDSSFYQELGDKAHNLKVSKGSNIDFDGLTENEPLYVLSFYNGEREVMVWLYNNGIVVDKEGNFAELIRHEINSKAYKALLSLFD